MGNAVSHRARPPPACRACMRMLPGEARLTAHRHRLTLCGRRSSEHAASPAAWEAPSHTVTARLRLAGHTYARSKRKPGSLPTDTSSPFAVSDPANTPPAPPHGSAFLACACPHPLTHQAEPPPHRRPIPRTAKNRTHPRACPVFYGIRRGYALAERI